MIVHNFDPVFIDLGLIQIRSAIQMKENQYVHAVLSEGKLLSVKF